ncbi:MAG: serine/threonine-protein kinase, partial [Myxococcota bacterium]
MKKGDRIGTYEVLEELASGGMAQLYLGRRVGPAGFERLVAIKVVRPYLAGQPEFVSMFLDEGRLAARIAHPNVVHIEELGEDEGRYFLVMEYVHGVALSELLANLGRLERRLTPAAAVAIAMRVAAGLHAAHEIRGEDGRLVELVHRDVSPQNVFLASNGAVKLIDFGIAKARDRLHVTSPGTGLRGKLRYMAPEQFHEAPRIDRRTDVYALGVVLWEMLVMRRLFQGKRDDEVIREIVGGGMPSPGSLAPVPPALDAVVMAALAKDQDARPTTARELRLRLREALPEALAIDDVELAAMLWAVCSDVLNGRGQSDERHSGPGMNTLELAELPVKALESLTRPLDAAEEAVRPAFAQVLPSSVPPPEALQA